MKNITPFRMNPLSLVLGILFIIGGIILIADLAWEFVKFAIGMIVILIGFGLLGAHSLKSSFMRR